MSFSGIWAGKQRGGSRERCWGGSFSGWKGHVELGRKGVQDVVVFLGFEWGQGCEC